MYLGGLCLNHKPGRRRLGLTDPGIVVLRGVDLDGNRAEAGGGGIMASHPRQVILNCSMQATTMPITQNITEGFVRRFVSNQMQRLMDTECPFWRENSVAESGYGPVKATFASSASACMLKGDRCERLTDRLPEHRSTELIPAVKITLVDQFGQLPAEAHPDSKDISVTTKSSRHVRLFGQLSVGFERGEASITDAAVTGQPGRYRLVLHFSDKRIDDIRLSTALAECSIGEESVVDNTACQTCEMGTYSVRKPLDKCEDCPDNCVCNRWGIAPKSNYWISSPCTTKAEKCLSDIACDYGIVDLTVTSQPIGSFVL